MITLTIEEAQQVLFWLKFIDLPTTDNLSKMISAKLAQPNHIADERKKVCPRCGKVNPAEIHTCSPKQPEPVAWMYVNSDGECEQIEYGEVFDDPSVTPLYTAPPQREWVGLTDEEVDEGAKERWVAKQSFEAGAWWANEKLREKNV